MGRFFLFISLLLLARCSAPYKVVEFKRGDFRSICLEGDGKGRLNAFGDKYVFNYTSLIEDKTWMMGLDFPLHGEEVLSLPLRAGGRFGGDFYLRVEDAYYNFSKKDKRYSIKQFNQFMKDLSTLIKSIVRKNNFFEKCEKLNLSKCSFELKKQRYSAEKTTNGISITKIIDNTFILKLNSREFENGLYKRHTIELRRSEQRKNQYDIRFELKHKDCVRS